MLVTAVKMPVTDMLERNEDKQGKRNMARKAYTQT